MNPWSVSTSGVTVGGDVSTENMAVAVSTTKPLSRQMVSRTWKPSWRGMDDVYVKSVPSSTFWSTTWNGTSFDAPIR